jgi:hypothetical protein
VRELLGHKTLVMTQRYAHLSPGHLRRPLERLVQARSDTGSSTSVVGGLGFRKQGGSGTTEENWCREAESQPHAHEGHQIESGDRAGVYPIGGRGECGRRQAAQSRVRSQRPRTFVGQLCDLATARFEAGRRRRLARADRYASGRVVTPCLRASRIRSAVVLSPGTQGPGTCGSRPCAVRRRSPSWCTFRPSSRSTSRWRGVRGEVPGWGVRGSANVSTTS